MSVQPAGQQPWADRVPPALGAKGPVASKGRHRKNHLSTWPSAFQETPAWVCQGQGLSPVYTV